MIVLLSSQTILGQNVIKLATQIISVGSVENIDINQTLFNSKLVSEKNQSLKKSNSISNLKFSKRKTEKQLELSFKSNDELFFVEDGLLLVKSIRNSNRKISDLFVFSFDIFSVRHTEAKLFEVRLSNGATFLIDSETALLLSATTVGNEPDSEFNLVKSPSSNYPKSTICCVQKDGTSKNDRFKFFHFQNELNAEIFSFEDTNIKVFSNQNIWCEVTGRLYEKRSTSKTGDLSLLLALSTFNFTSFKLITSIFIQPKSYFRNSNPYFINKYERLT